MAYILEETKGNLPLWLAPTQVKVLPVKNEYHLDYTNEIYQLLLNEGFEVELDSRDEKLGYRIREAQMQKATTGTIDDLSTTCNISVDKTSVTYKWEFKIRANMLGKRMLFKTISGGIGKKV